MEDDKALLKWIDIPPVWLALFATAAWLIGRADLWSLSFGGAWSDFAAGLLIGGGLLLLLLAVVDMRKWRTTVIPHREASHLVQSGIFSRSRNPIYLGDVLVLAGLVLRFDAPEALALVPVFFWWIERHFILAEEDRLRRKYRAEFARYCEKTRRWL
jgi:protein-S-isoprenylcysteine O-methyltransferase Ste14